MATPESNALLMMQIFENGFRPLGQQNAERTRLQQLMRAEQAKQAEFEREAELRYGLAGMQADREDTRADNTFKKEGQRLTALQTQTETKIAESERKQIAAIEAAEKKQIRAQLVAKYPTYVREAEKLDEKAMALEDFEESWAGVGQINAQLERMQEARVTRDQTDNAQLGIRRLNEFDTALSDAEKEINALKTPTKEESQIAKSQAIQEVKTALEKKVLASAVELQPKQIANGLAALAAGGSDSSVARESFGKAADEVLSAYDSAFQRTLMGLDSTKAKMQRVTLAERSREQIASAKTAFEKNLWTAAGTSRPLNKALIERTPLENLMAPTPKGKRTFEDVTPAPGGTGAAVTQPVIPNAPTGAPANSDQTLTRLQELGLFQRPIIQQGRASVFAPTTPEMLETARGSLTSEIGRTQALGTRGAPTRLQLLQSLLSQLPSTITEPGFEDY